LPAARPFLCCGSVCFVETEFTFDRDRLPALACDGCGVLELDEDLGASAEERTRLHWAIVARTATWRPPSLRGDSDAWAFEMPTTPRLASLVR
jgi:hypothetical protein